MKVYNVIMAGGGGTRFWPISRQANPKQLLNLSGSDTLINETIDRVNKLSCKENLFVVTNKKQVQQLKDITKDRLLPENILIEPSARNTSAAIGYAAFNIMKRYGDGIMCIYPADHHIKNEEEFLKVLNKAIKVADTSDKIVTIGVKPTFPSTGYGYINFDKSNIINEYSYDVIEFIEKPKFKKAVEYIESGSYLWNSGMFVWKVSKVLDDFKRYLPKLYDKLEILSQYIDKEEVKMINEIYPTIPSISVDYGIMERSNDVVVVPADFGWNDVGSWDVLGNIFPTDNKGNICRGETITIDSKNSVVYSDDKLLTTVGIKDLIVVSTEDAVMVCPKNRAQDVKFIVEELKEQSKVDYL